MPGVRHAAPTWPARRLDRRRGGKRGLARPLERLALDQLVEAGRLLEGREAGRRRAPPRSHLHPPGRSEPGDAADEAPKQEGAEGVPAPSAVHAGILRRGARLLSRAVICTLGDLLLDVIVRLDGPIASDTDTYGQTSVSAGGQAANVAAWVAALGGRARFVGKRARDPAGKVALADLRRSGVDVLGPEVETGTGTVVSLATPDGRRTMLTDRGVAPTLAPDELDLGWFSDCEWLHVPGYSLVREPIAEAARAAARAAPRVSVDASSVSAIAEIGREAFVEAVDDLRPAVVFANEAEAAIVGAVASETLVVKLGERGCRIGEREHRARPTPVVDSTGAGDAFAAGYLLGGVELALDAAARCVAKPGAMP